MDIRTRSAARTKKAPKNILAETDFYTLKGNYTIEKTLAQIESEYSSIFERKVRNKQPLSAEEHVLFCAFAAAMLQRTLKQKENIEGFIDQVIEKVTDLEKAYGMSPKTSEEWKANKEHAHKLSVMAMIPQIAGILSQTDVRRSLRQMLPHSYSTARSSFGAFRGLD